MIKRTIIVVGFIFGFIFIPLVTGKVYGWSNPKDYTLPSWFIYWSNGFVFFGVAFAAIFLGYIIYRYIKDGVE